MRFISFVLLSKFQLTLILLSILEQNSVCGLSKSKIFLKLIYFSACLLANYVLYVYNHVSVSPLLYVIPWVLVRIHLEDEM